MLNPFPHLLIYSFYVPTLLRLTATLVFIYIAYRIIRTKETVQSTELPFVGHAQGWMVWFSAIITILVAFFLFIGLGTQWAAIAAMVIALTHAFLAKKHAALLPLSRGAYMLLFVICLSLLISGAGAFASDIPL